MRFCTRCVLPSTKPDLHFDDEGVCSACTNYQNRTAINWEERRTEFLRIVAEAKQADQGAYDCIIPCSGGKDSTYQTLLALRHGLNPLCVTATTCDLSELGRKNIENLKSLGVDYLEFSPNKLTRRRLNRLGLEELGDISWPEHVSIFTIPVQVAVRYRIPLILWGENSQNEYGGPNDAVASRTLDRAWLEEFGGLLGLRVSDLISSGQFTTREMAPYIYPHTEDIEAVGITGLFSGYFFPWDGLSNFLRASSAGFSTKESRVEGSYVNYENLDNLQTGIHDYFKFLKFGFGRATDISSLLIRRGLAERHVVIEQIREIEGKFPWSYLGRPLAQILSPLGLTVEEFEGICDRFTNVDLFETDASGNLDKDINKNLTKKMYDN